MSLAPPVCCINALTLGLLLLFFILPAHSSLSKTPDIDQKTLAFVAQQATDFLARFKGARHQLSIRPGRKSLTKCQQPLSFSRTNSNRPPIGTVRVTIECTGRWKSYRVVNVSAWVPVVVSQTALSRHHSLSRKDVKLTDMPWKRLRGHYFTSVEPLLGRDLKRRIPAGQLLNDSLLTPRYLIRKGDAVTIQAGDSGLQVSMTGTAMENGEQKQTIQVRNRSSGKTIDAQVIAKGKVKALF